MNEYLRWWFTAFVILTTVAHPLWLMAKNRTTSWSADMRVVGWWAVLAYWWKP